MWSIMSGTGNGKRVGVSDDKRMFVDAITETIQESGTISGDTFNLATGRIVLTGQDESALFYLRNMEERSLMISSVFVNTLNPVGTPSGQPIITIYRNPTEGTILTNPMDVDVVSNNNFGEAKVLTANIYKGDYQKTLAGSSAIIEVPAPSVAAAPLLEFDTRVVLPRGAAYGVSYQMQPGLTNMTVITGVVVTRLPKEF